LLKVLGDSEEALSRSYTVRNKEELGQLLDDDAFARAEKMQLVEVIMERMDAPRALKVQAGLSGKTNMYA
jgi:pyruvate decarboxylase